MTTRRFSIAPVLVRTLIPPLLIAASSALVLLANGETHATIESCSGCALNKLPALKSFLKDGEAETYRNVGVNFVHGRKAVMTIYEGDDDASSRDDWVEKERITLSDYGTKEEMHALMVEKGFQLKSEEEIEALKLQKQEEAADEEGKRAKHREEARQRREKIRLEREQREREEREADKGIDGTKEGAREAIAKDEL